MSVQLKRPEQGMKEQFEIFINQWEQRIIPSSLENGKQSFEELLVHLYTMENDPPRLLVPSTMFFLVEDTGKILGAIDIRHFLNEGLLKYGGHIAYGVAPDSRGQGYAKLMVDMSKDYIKSLGIDRVLICCDKENLASAKTIISCGGILESEVPRREADKEFVGQRYWVKI
ncbi:MAG: GNAT family N-acetyltransferase [Oscillospiraceae bacterium]